jgi:monofunctional biosynthetic peptidoglycan transglycosylase
LSGTRVLYDFAVPGTASQFLPIDDVVMGGRSSSRLEPGDGFAAFRGEVSLANGGGFASVRSAPSRLDLSGAEGIALRVRGDGRAYKLNLRTDDRFDGVTYQAALEPQAGAWQTVTLPFRSFRPRFRGRPVDGAPPLDPARIATIGFLVADRREGAFRLEIAALGAYSGGAGEVSFPARGGG